MPVLCAASAFAWASLAAWRAGVGTSGFALRAVLGGAAAFGIAFASYDLAAASGIEVSWDRMLDGDLDALALAAGIGLVEEGAKLAGVLLVVGRGARTSVVLAAAAGVAAGFAGLEALFMLRGIGPSPVSLARVALGPVAHAALAVPLAFAVAVGARGGGRAWLVLVPGVLASAALHGGADLSLTLPRLGAVAHAAVLAAPVLWAFARARRPAPAVERAPLPSVRAPSA
jgi:RsiW-degrading membrane proteinase PrsW (M82 family)